MTLLLKSYNLLKSNKGNTIYSQQLAVNNSYLVSCILSTCILSTRISKKVTKVTDISVNSQQSTTCISYNFSFFTFGSADFQFVFHFSLTTILQRALMVYCIDK